jgi:hypothetical protein
VDQGYTGSGKAWIEEQLGWRVEVVQHPPKPRGVWAPSGAVIDWDTLRPQGFRGVLPRRWVVERTQPHYPRRPRVDRWPIGCDYRAHRVAPPGRGCRAGASSPRFATRGRGGAMSGPAVSRVPPRPVRARKAVAGSTCR